MLKPIYQRLVKPLSECRKARWLGPDGAWCRGVILSVLDEDDKYAIYTILNEHKREVVELLAIEFEYDVPKDDAGNPR
jgi:hypothetical protein